MAAKKSEKSWREKVGAEFLYPNKDWFISRSLVVPDSIDGLEDHQLVIKLGGLKLLLKERGYSRVFTKLKHIQDDYVTARCTIVFKPLEDEPKVEYTANASANRNNTDDFGLKYIETIAENRAFARCIRNFLNINIVSDEELTKGKPAAQNEQKVSSLSFQPVDILKSTLEKKYNINSFVKFKQTILREMWNEKSYVNTPETINSWEKFEDIPVPELRILIALLKERT